MCVAIANSAPDKPASATTGKEGQKTAVTVAGTDDFEDDAETEVAKEPETLAAASEPPTLTTEFSAVATSTHILRKSSWNFDMSTSGLAEVVASSDETSLAPSVGKTSSVPIDSSLATNLESISTSTTTTTTTTSTTTTTTKTTITTTTSVVRRLNVKYVFSVKARLKEIILLIV